MESPGSSVLCVSSSTSTSTSSSAECLNLCQMDYFLNSWYGNQCQLASSDPSKLAQFVHRTALFRSAEDPEPDGVSDLLDPTGLVNIPSAEIGIGILQEELEDEIFLEKIRSLTSSVDPNPTPFFLFTDPDPFLLLHVPRHVNHFAKISMKYFQESLNFEPNKLVELICGSFRNAVSLEIHGSLPNYNEVEAMLQKYQYVFIFLQHRMGENNLESIMGSSLPSKVKQGAEGPG